MDHERFMKMAIEEARSALSAGEFPVGAVITDGSEVLATGGRRGTSGKSFNETDHAEMVALGRLSLPVGFEPKGRLVIYSTLEPCLMCFGAAVINGITDVVYGYEDVMGGGTSCDLSLLPPLYSNRSITVKGGVMREQCLALFRRYFEDPAHAYLRDTLLAKHALSVS